MELNETLRLPDHYLLKGVQSTETTENTVGAAASFEGNIKGEGNLVTVKTTLKLNKRVYEASDWFSFRKAVNMAKSYNRYFVAKKR